MRAKIAHITTANGTPICKLGMFLEIHKITCSHKSIASAKRTLKELRKEAKTPIERGALKFFKVIEGPCPAV